MSRRKIKKTWKLRRKHIYLLIYLITCIVFLQLTQVIVNNHLSTKGVELGEITDKTSSLRLQNQQLREEIYQSASLKTIEVKAKRMGFIEGPLKPYLIR